MIGENFKRINRNIRESKTRIAYEKACIDHHDYIRQADSDSWSFDELNRLTEECKVLEYELWCENYNH